MKVNKITNQVTIKPSERRIKKIKTAVGQMDILPKELPLKKEVRVVSQSEIFERIKDKIQIAVENITK